jgi:uroporphyrinogen-III synthase
MKTLITRPPENAGGSLSLLKERGHDVIHCPLLTIEYLPHKLSCDDMDKIDAFAFTSANGARAFLRLYHAGDISKNCKIFCVGDASFQLFQEKGFQHLFNARGDIHALFALLKSQVTKGSFIAHIATCDTVGDLVGKLLDVGYNAQKYILYHVQNITAFDKKTYDAFSKGQIQNILFYSPKTANNFMNIVENTPLDIHFESINAYCLSDNIANVIKKLSWGGVKIAKNPNEQSLMDLLV